MQHKHKHTHTHTQLNSSLLSIGINWRKRRIFWHWSSVNHTHTRTHRVWQNLDTMASCFRHLFCDTRAQDGRIREHDKHCVCEKVTAMYLCKMLIRNRDISNANDSRTQARNTNCVSNVWLSPPSAQICASQSHLPLCTCPPTFRPLQRRKFSPVKQILTRWFKDSRHSPAGTESPNSCTVFQYFGSKPSESSVRTSDKVAWGCQRDGLLSAGSVAVMLGDFFLSAAYIKQTPFHMSVKIKLSATVSLLLCNVCSLGKPIFQLFAYKSVITFFSRSGGIFIRALKWVRGSTVPLSQISAGSLLLCARFEPKGNLREQFNSETGFLGHGSRYCESLLFYQIDVVSIALLGYRCTESNGCARWDLSSNIF